MAGSKVCCERCFIFLRDYLEATNQNRFFLLYLDEYTNLLLDFTRLVSKSSIYGAKARANLYMKSDNVLYYSFLLKVIKANTIQTRFIKEYNYLRCWLVEKNYLKSYNKKNPFEAVDIYLDTTLIKLIDMIYEIHDVHLNPKIETIMIELVEEDDWSEYESISS
jgi:hypothetical protein